LPDKSTSESSDLSSSPAQSSPPPHFASLPCRFISLAPQIKAYSGGLYKALKPLANAYANIVGHRKMGLKYDDLITEERDDIQRVSTAVRGLEVEYLLWTREVERGPVWTTHRRGLE
jgi:hypothetical protein